MPAAEEDRAKDAREAETLAGLLPQLPSRHVAAVACTGARLNVCASLGLNEGEAHVTSAPRKMQPPTGGQ